MSCPGVMSRRRGRGGPLGKGAVVTRPEADALDVWHAVLRYDVRGNDAGARPVLLLMGHRWVPLDSAPRPGGMDEPDAFAAIVREVLSGRWPHRGALAECAQVRGRRVTGWANLA